MVADIALKQAGVYAILAEIRGMVDGHQIDEGIRSAMYHYTDERIAAAVIALMELTGNQSNLNHHSVLMGIGLLDELDALGYALERKTNGRAS
jgi:hypothetical protein